MMMMSTPPFAFLSVAPSLLILGPLVVIKGVAKNVLVILIILIISVAIHVASTSAAAAMSTASVFIPTGKYIARKKDEHNYDQLFHEDPFLD
jgi:hypothetical protein